MSQSQQSHKGITFGLTKYARQIPHKEPLVCRKFITNTFEVVTLSAGTTIMTTVVCKKFTLQKTDNYVLMHRCIGNDP